MIYLLLILIIIVLLIIYTVYFMNKIVRLIDSMTNDLNYDEEDFCE